MSTPATITPGEDGSSNGFDETPDPSTAPPPTTAPPTTPTTVTTTSSCRSESGLCAAITGIALEGDRFVADYTTTGFLPLMPGEDPGATDSDHHVHFFFDTTSPGNAGANGNPPGSWEMWGLQRGGGRFVFDAFTVGDAAGASQLCIAVATSGHDVLADAAAHRQLRRPADLRMRAHDDDDEPNRAHVRLARGIRLRSLPR